MTLTPRFAQALAYSAQLHAGQFRKGTGVPYIAHLLAVAAIALEHGATEDEAIAALLHDAIEDQGGLETRDEIRHHFGVVVTEIVEGCTDADTVPKPPWRARKETYLAHLSTASDSIHLVCASDKLHNARSLVADYRMHGEQLWDRFSGGREGTLWYYREVARILNQSRHRALVEQLAQAVSDLERLAGGSTS